MDYVTNHRFKRWKRNHRIWGATATFLCCICLFLFTPTIPRSSNQHQFADVRNLLGVPNTLNVMTNFPFLVVGVLGFVFALDGSFFNISSQGEVWGWVVFYGGMIGVAFGSAYYHLKPDNHRVLWDTLPVSVTLQLILVHCWLCGDRN